MNNGKLVDSFFDLVKEVGIIHHVGGYGQLYNNVEVPVLGIGTFMISPEDTEKSVYAALKLGYRMIDTANAYMNEEAVGKALKKAINEGIVTREEVFVSTKIWATLYENENAVDDTLKRLDLDYVDLLFIHQPAGNYMAGYRMLEEAYKDGKAKSLGISNFEGEKLEKLLADSEIKPHVIQMEAHPYCTEKEIRDRLAEYGTATMGWYPLGHGDRGLVNEEVFTKLADKYRKSNAQIVLRWHTQMGFITGVFRGDRGRYYSEGSGKTGCGNHYSFLFCIEEVVGEVIGV